MSELQLREQSETAQKKRTVELVNALKSPPQKRSSQQASRVAQFLSTIPGVNKLTSALLNRLVHHCTGVEYFDGQVIYRASDSALFFFIIVIGHVVLTDVKDSMLDEGDDNVIARLGAREWFGHEEILSNSRRAFTASALKGETLCIRVPMEEYRKGLEDIHMVEFDDKVGFISSLAPMKPLNPETVRKLAPCFSVQEFKAKEVVVRQGEKADAMYAVRSGYCNVVVDPHYKNQDNKQLGNLDPARTLQVCTLNPGAIIGDITVLASVTKRTASVIAGTDLVAYKIFRPVFLRRVPPDQLDILKRIANEKMNLTDSKVRSKPANQTLQNRILHGRNLRELSKLPKKDDQSQGDSSGYLELIHLLRRYKRAPVPKIAPPLPVSEAGFSQTAAPGLKSAAQKTPPSPGQLLSPTSYPDIRTGTSKDSSPARHPNAGARLVAELEQAELTSQGGRSSDPGLRTRSSNAAGESDRDRVRASSPRPAALRVHHSYAHEGNADTTAGPNSPLGSPASPKARRHTHTHSTTHRVGSPSIRASRSSSSLHASSAASPDAHHSGRFRNDDHTNNNSDSMGSPHQLLPSKSAFFSSKSPSMVHGGGVAAELPGHTFGGAGSPDRGVTGDPDRKRVIKGGWEEEMEEEDEEKQQWLRQQRQAEGGGVNTGSAAVSTALAEHLGLDSSTGGRHHRSQPPPLISFAAPRKDVHSSQAAQSPKRGMTSMAHQQGPPLNAFSDIHSPSQAQGQPLNAGSSNEPGAAQENTEGPNLAGQGSRPASAGVMQSRRLQSSYHTRPMGTSNTLRTISPLMLEALDARYSAHTHPHAHAHAHTYPSPLGGGPSTLPASLQSLTPLQGAHVPHAHAHAHAHASHAHARAHAWQPHHAGHTLAQPLARSTHSAQHSTLDARPESAGVGGLPSVRHARARSEGAALGGSRQEGDGVRADGEPQLQHSQQHIKGEDQQPEEGAQASTNPAGSDAASHPTHQGRPLGPISFTQRPSLSTPPLKSPLLRFQGASHFKSASGPCTPASQLENTRASGLHEERSQSDDEGAPKREPSEGASTHIEAGGWSSSNLALPQYRTLMAAGGLHRYLRQLQYNKELEKLQAMQKSAVRLDAVLDKMGGPLLESKANPVLRKGAAHFKPVVPKALL